MKLLWQFEMNRLSLYTILLILLPLNIWGSFLDYFYPAAPEPPKPIPIISPPPINAGCNSHPIEKICNVEQLGAFAIAEWQNTNLIMGGLSYTKESISRDNSCFVHFNSLQDCTAWILPLGFYSQYETPLKEKTNTNIDIRRKAFGIKSGLEINVLDHLLIGAGLGYLYSDIKWQNFKGKGHNNSLSIEPYAAYTFTKGMIALNLIGIGNLYGGSLAYCKEQPTSINHTSWNFGVRLGGTMDIEIPKSVTPGLIFYPHAEFTYTNVFETEYKDIESRRSSFIQSLLSFSFAKTVRCTKAIFIKPSLSLGWAGWYPITSDPLKVKKISACSVKPLSKNQLFLAIELVSFYKKGIVWGLTYNAYIGNHSPIQFGQIGIEWNW